MALLVLAWRRSAWAIAMMVIVASGGVYRALAPADAAPTRQLLVRIPQDLSDLDPARIRTGEDQNVAFAIYSRLVKYRLGDFRTVEPDLAEKWTVSPDGRLYTFWLRKGVKWHKGYGEVTAQDVKYTLSRLSDSSTGSLYLSQVAIIDEVRVIDKYQVSVRLKRPYPGFLAEFLAYRPGFIVNAKAIADLKDRYTPSAVGSGAFVLERWEPGVRVLLRANPDYYGRKPRVDRVELVLIREDSLFEIALEKGDVDLGYIADPEVQQRVIQSKNARTIVKVAPQTLFVTINTSVSPWNDVRVRKALWYATDRQGIIDSVFRGRARVSDTLLNPYVFGYLGRVAYKYDPEHAQRLLREAGYPNGLAVEYAYYPFELQPKAAPALQASWRKVGINVTLKQYEVVALFERYRQRTHSISANAVMRVGPDQIFSAQLHSAATPFPNASQYRNSEMDTLIDSARAEIDERKRAALYRRAQEKVLEDAPMIPLYHPPLVLAARPNVKGVVFPGLQAFNLADIYKE
jgi:peptide/nickel transport system substrate-binding protein